MDIFCFFYIELKFILKSEKPPTENPFIMCAFVNKHSANSLPMREGTSKPKLLSWREEKRRASIFKVSSYFGYRYILLSSIITTPSFPIARQIISPEVLPFSKEVSLSLFQLHFAIKKAKNDCVPQSVPEHKTHLGDKAVTQTVLKEETRIKVHF